MDKKLIKKDNLIYPELCYQIVGILFDVYNKLGHGHPEKTYQKAVAIALKNSHLSFKEQVYAPVIYADQRIGSNYFDFLVDNKVVVEIKKGDHFSKSHIDQLYRYLVINKLKLGLLVYFTLRKIHFKRIVNL